MAVDMVGGRFDRRNGIVTAEEILAMIEKDRISVEAIRGKLIEARLRQRMQAMVSKTVPNLTQSEIDFRIALANRDIAQVYRLLQRVGVSQRTIAAATGQSQSEIADILGGRRVVAYDVLARIADGLTVKRGMMGLGHDEETRSLLGLDTV